MWCEGARIHLNPFSPTFDLDAAANNLIFAARFTPQYGDSFLEHLRLKFIDQCLIPIAEPLINETHATFLAHDKMSLSDAYNFIGGQVKHAADVVKTQLNESYDIAKFLHVLDASDLELQCSSADPNYGQVWFQCRKSPIDTAWEVFNQAKSMLAADIVHYGFVYVAAIIRRTGVILLTNYYNEKIISSSNSDKAPIKELPSPNSHEWDAVVNTQLRKAPSLNEMLLDGKDYDVSNLSSQMFITAHADSSKSRNQLSSKEKLRILFGSDSLLS